MPILILRSIFGKEAERAVDGEIKKVVDVISDRRVCVPGARTSGVASSGIYSYIRVLHY